MIRAEFIRDFVGLGFLLDAFLNKKSPLPALDKAIQQSLQTNYWFAEHHITQSLRSITDNFLQPDKLHIWLAAYPNIAYTYQNEVAIVMAGNIPLVGYHDYLSILASGKKTAIKLSSKDPFLLPALHELLCSFAPEWHSRVRFVPEVPSETDTIIATGSDSTAAWFTTHYPHLPKIIRGHRVSVAIIPPHITQEQITALHRDMFLYFGLGCRSVVKLFLPDKFDITRITDIDTMPEEPSHLGFRNAYRRQKALLTLQQRPLIDGRFFILQEADTLSPPVATIYYTYYSHIDEVVTYIHEHDSQIQCVAGVEAYIKKSVIFGSTQNPQLWDYADGIDTMKL